MLLKCLVITNDSQSNVKIAKKYMLCRTSHFQIYFSCNRLFQLNHFYVDSVYINNYDAIISHHLVCFKLVLCDIDFENGSCYFLKNTMKSVQHTYKKCTGTALADISSKLCTR